MEAGPFIPRSRALQSSISIKHKEPAAAVRCCAGEAATDETNCLIMKPDICEHNTNCSVCWNILEKYQIVVNPQINLRGSIKTEWIFILSKVYKTQIYLAWAPRVPKLTTIKLWIQKCARYHQDITLIKYKTVLGFSGLKCWKDASMINLII